MRSRCSAGNTFAQEGARLCATAAAPQAMDGALWMPLSALAGAVSPGCWGRPETARIRNSTPDPLASVATPMAGGLDTADDDCRSGARRQGSGRDRDWAVCRKKDYAGYCQAAGGGADRDSGLTAELTREQRRLRVAAAAHAACQRSATATCSFRFTATATAIRRSTGAEAYFLKPARTARAIDVALKENSVGRSWKTTPADYRELTQDELHPAAWRPART